MLSVSQNGPIHPPRRAPGHAVPRSRKKPSHADSPHRPALGAAQRRVAHPAVRPHPGRLDGHRHEPPRPGARRDRRRDGVSAHRPPRARPCPPGVVPLRRRARAVGGHRRDRRRPLPAGARHPRRQPAGRGLARLLPPRPGGRRAPVRPPATGARLAGAAGRPRPRGGRGLPGVGHARRTGDLRGQHRHPRPGRRGRLPGPRPAELHRPGLGAATPPTGCGGSSPRSAARRWPAWPAWRATCWASPPSPAPSPQPAT